MTSVLVTRPEGQGETLAAEAAARGLSVHSLPLLQLLPVAEPPPIQRQQVMHLDHYQHLIFISGNAVRYGMAWIESIWPQLPAGLCWYAVGEATARSLSAHGVTAVTPGAVMTSEGLLGLPQLQTVRGERILIVKGEGGRSTMSEELGRRGALVDDLVCYRRAAPAYAPGEVAQSLSQWGIDLILISSGEGLENLLALLSPAETTKFNHITLLVPSDRVARVARAAGFRRVITAENASDSAMLRALEVWQSALESDE